MKADKKGEPVVRSWPVSCLSGSTYENYLWLFVLEFSYVPFAPEVVLSIRVKTNMVSINTSRDHL